MELIVGTLNHCQCGGLIWSQMKPLWSELRRTSELGCIAPLGDPSQQWVTYHDPFCLPTPCAFYGREL